jgi:hypothetical protein
VLLVDDIELSHDEEAEEMSRCGKIEITVKLGSAKISRVGKPLRSNENELLSTRTSKKIAIDCGKSHSIEYALMTSPIECCS